jgi:hypothetical protein
MTLAPFSREGRGSSCITFRKARVAVVNIMYIPASDSSLCFGWCNASVIPISPECRYSQISVQNIAWGCSKAAIHLCKTRVSTCRAGMWDGFCSAHSWQLTCSLATTQCVHSVEEKYCEE